MLVLVSWRVVLLAAVLLYSARLASVPLVSGGQVVVLLLDAALASVFEVAIFDEL